MTDMEGCAGILNRENWVVPEGRYFEQGRRILTEEVNAAIDGFFQGGASGITVCDGHYWGGVDPLLLDERVEFMNGCPDPAYPFDLDSSYAAIAHVGQHAKAGTDYSHLTHTQDASYIDCSINGLSIGEYGMTVLCGMELGIPSIFGSGEEAFCREAEELTPGIFAVSVKRGLLRDGLEHLTTSDYRVAKLSAVHIHHNEACRRIRTGALQAIEKLKASPDFFSYPSLTKPYVRIDSRRGDCERSPYTARAEHPDSVIALLNMSPQEIA